jgi:hypothetical protein
VADQICAPSVSASAASARRRVKRGALSAKTTGGRLRGRVALLGARAREVVEEAADASKARPSTASPPLRIGAAEQVEELASLAAQVRGAPAARG